MKIIEKLTELIDEEIHDVKKYAILASEVKAEWPGLAQVFITLSMQEEAHQKALHDEVVKIIEMYRKEHGAPPPAMQAVYDHEHKRYIKHMEEARRYQEIYKAT